MKPHSRIRKAIKWGGAAVTVLLVVAWIGSGWWCVARNEWGRVHLLLGAGRIEVVRFASDHAFPHSPPGVFARPLDSFELQWRFEYENAGDQMWVVRVPVWPLLLASLLSTAIAWRLDTVARRRALLNLCPKCNYNRAGLVKEAVCPECGAAAG